MFRESHKTNRHWIKYKMKVQSKHMTAYVELEITDYKTFEQLVEDWSVTEQNCSGTLMFEWYISDCKTNATLIETFASYARKLVTA